MNKFDQAKADLATKQEDAKEERESKIESQKNKQAQQDALVHQEALTKAQKETFDRYKVLVSEISKAVNDSNLIVQGLKVTRDPMTDKNHNSVVEAASILEVAAGKLAEFLEGLERVKSYKFLVSKDK